MASPSSAVPLRELHLLPAPQLLAQPPVAPRLGRLPLQRAALLLDLEDDVVDAGQVLLRRLELQLRGAAAALVLRDAGRFLDQLPPIGRPRAENLADLALLDDRVGLDAEPGVHQQVLHVAQPADLAVDQVFALARSVEPAHQLDVADDQRRLVVQRSTAAPQRLAVCASTSTSPAAAVDGRFARRQRGLAQRRHAGALVARHARGDAAQPQADFRGAGRLARIAAAENDVLHAIAAQALGALLAEHPGDRIDDVALAAAVRPDDGGDAGVEGELGPIRKALEAGNLETIATA